MSVSMWQIFVMVFALGTVPPPQAAHTVNDAAWLAGCWTREGNGRQYDEQWMKPAGGTMFGMSRTVSKGRTSASEFLQLKEEEGAVYYIAKPSNQAETRFRLVEVRDGFLRFENPEHDFPTVIMYTRGADGALLAQIQGPMNGQTRTIAALEQRQRVLEAADAAESLRRDAYLAKEQPLEMSWRHPGSLRDARDRHAAMRLVQPLDRETHTRIDPRGIGQFEQRVLDVSRRHDRLARRRARRSKRARERRAQVVDADRRPCERSLRRRHEGRRPVRMKPHAHHGHAAGGAHEKTPRQLPGEHRSGLTRPRAILVDDLERIAQMEDQLRPPVGQHGRDVSRRDAVERPHATHERCEAGMRRVLGILHGAPILCPPHARRVSARRCRAT
jgi:hypothetical protein